MIAAPPVINDSPKVISARRPALRDALRGRFSDATTWVSGLLGIVSLSALSGTPIPAPCPCCGGMACPNGAAIQGILGGAAALGLQFWSRFWNKRRPDKEKGDKTS